MHQPEQTELPRLDPRSTPGFFFVQYIEQQGWTTYKPSTIMLLQRQLQSIHGEVHGYIVQPRTPNLANSTSHAPSGHVIHASPTADGDKLRAAQNPLSRPSPQHSKQATIQATQKSSIPILASFRSPSPSLIGPYKPFPSLHPSLTMQPRSRSPFQSSFSSSCDRQIRAWQGSHQPPVCENFFPLALALARVGA